MPRQVIILILITFVTSCNRQNVPQLKIACASSAEKTIDSLAHFLEEHNEIDIEVISNSSGILSTQILQGAPFDLFISADSLYPHQIAETLGLNPPFYFASGQLAFVYNKSVSGETIEEIITSSANVAIPNPTFAPYGIAATDYCEHISLSTEHFILAENVNHTNQMLFSGQVDAIFTSFSSLPKHLNNHSVIQMDKKYYSTPNHYGIILKKSDEVTKFLNLLNSSMGKSILESFGYLVN